MDYITPKKVLGLFAHPDDESFGPGGTLALWAKQGAEIIIICVTDGNHGKIGTTRVTEMQEAATVLGIKQIIFLEYRDGFISNHDLLAIEEKFCDYVKTYKPDTIITFNLNGMSGHLDHIAVASAATQAFRKTRIAKKLYYYTLLKSQSIHMDDYFIYFPEGEEVEDIDEAIDVSSVWNIRRAAAEKHVSQKHDMEKFLAIIGDSDKKEYFKVKSTY